MNKTPLNPPAAKLYNHEAEVALEERLLRLKDSAEDILEELLVERAEADYTLRALPVGLESTRRMDRIAYGLKRLLGAREVIRDGRRALAFDELSSIKREALSHFNETLPNAAPDDDEDNTHAMAMDRIHGEVA